MASIFHISEAAAIGIHAAVLMAGEPDETWSARKIADTLAVSHDHCVRVLHRLRRCGILRSVRGPSGGFQLTAAPDAISVLRIYEALEGELADRECLFQVAKCAGGCPLFRDLMHSINHQAREFFTETTVADLAGGKHEENS